MEEVIDNNKAQRLNSDKMGKTPILKLLVTMSLPAILSMLVQALYNIMDTVFVGMYYGGLGNAEYNAATQALGLAFPMQMIIVFHANSERATARGQATSQSTPYSFRHSVPFFWWQSGLRFPTYS